MHYKACCFANCQLSVGLECMLICILFLDWWSVQALFCTGHNQKKQTGMQERSLHQLCLWGWPAPMSWECLFNKRYVCLSCSWAVTPLILNPLVDCYNFLLWGDKNQGRWINQLDINKTENGGAAYFIWVQNFTFSCSTVILPERWFLLQLPRNLIQQTHIWLLLAFAMSPERRQTTISRERTLSTIDLKQNKTCPGASTNS